jgi:hypothetical protein
VAMTALPGSATIEQQIRGAVTSYDRDRELGVLLDRLKAVASAADPAVLKAAAAGYTSQPEVVIPLYESIVARDPKDAQSMVVLANAYWLTGRGPDVVDQLSSRAKKVDPTNRGAWHLWALSEPDLRRRVDRWREVTGKFPNDQLAKAALADNATSLASEEHDAAALRLALDAYAYLLAHAQNDEQRRALEDTLKTLRGWSW